MKSIFNSFGGVMFSLAFFVFGLWTGIYAASGAAHRVKEPPKNHQVFVSFHFWTASGAEGMAYDVLTYNDAYTGDSEALNIVNWEKTNVLPRMNILATNIVLTALTPLP
jgi:hypothetical protein